MSPARIAPAPDRAGAPPRAPRRVGRRSPSAPRPATRPRPRPATRGRRPRRAAGMRASERGRDERRQRLTLLQQRRRLARRVDVVDPGAAPGDAQALVLDLRDLLRRIGLLLQLLDVLAELGDPFLPAGV